LRSPAPADTSSAAENIDAILAKRLGRQQAARQSRVPDDTTFVRRLYLDVIGRIPTTREADAFLNDKATDKRAKFIDKLLGSEAYVQHSSSTTGPTFCARQSNGNQAGADHGRGLCELHQGRACARTTV